MCCIALPLYLRYISATSPLYLRYISPLVPHRVARVLYACDAPRLGGLARYRGDVGEMEGRYSGYGGEIPIRLPSISPISPLYLPYISVASSHSERRSIFESCSSGMNEDMMSCLSLSWRESSRIC